MKKHRYLLILLIIGLINCASYWNNRKKDAMDIFTFGIESPTYGLGLKLGPIALGYTFIGGETQIGARDLGKGYGLRGGNFGAYHSQQLIFGLLGGEEFYSGELKLDENGKVIKQKKLPVLVDERDNIKSHSMRYLSVYSDPPKERQQRQKQEVIKKLIKDIIPNPTPEILAAIPKENKKPNGYPRSFLYQFELVAGVYGGARIGFNPLELLDFILGFFTIDIIEDDVFKGNQTE